MSGNARRRGGAETGSGGAPPEGTARTPRGRAVTVEEPATTPLLSQLFGYGAIVPLVIGAVVAWLSGGILGALAVNLSILWGAAILIFLAGVRRGVSFRTPEGPTAAQIVVMLWLFATGLGTMLSVAVPVTPVAIGPHVLSFSLLTAGFASLIVLDPWSAERAEAPAFFRRLRPKQMGIASLALAALLVRML